MLFFCFQLAPLASRISPPRFRPTISAICKQAPGSFSLAALWVATISVFIGTATHLLLDSLTHARGWFVLHSSLLHRPVLTIHSHQVRVCHFLWYAVSFVGIAWLAIAFQNWRQRAVPDSASHSMSSRVFAGLLAATLVVPIEIAHHMVRSRLGLLLVTLLGVVLAAVAILWIAGAGARRRNVSPKAPPDPSNH
jgi:hypothetical protein